MNIIFTFILLLPTAHLGNVFSQEKLVEFNHLEIFESSKLKFNASLDFIDYFKLISVTTGYPLLDHKIQVADDSTENYVKILPRKATNVAFRLGLGTSGQMGDERHSGIILGGIGIQVPLITICDRTTSLGDLELSLEPSFELFNIKNTNGAWRSTIEYNLKLPITFASNSPLKIGIQYSTNTYSNDYFGIQASFYPFDRSVTPSVTTDHQNRSKNLPNKIERTIEKMNRQIDEQKNTIVNLNEDNKNLKQSIDSLILVVDSIKRNTDVISMMLKDSTLIYEYINKEEIDFATKALDTAYVRHKSKLEEMLRIFMFIGKSYFDVQEFQQSINYFLLVKQLIFVTNIQYPEVFYYLGFAYSQMNNIPMSCEELKIYLALVTENSEHRQEAVLQIEQCDKKKNVKSEKNEVEMISSESDYGNILQQYRGKVLVMHFWASWCKPCIKELKSFNQFYTKRNKELKEADVEILTISTDLSTNILIDYMRRERYTFPVMLDIMDQRCIEWANKRFVSSDKKIEGIPFTLIIDKNGRCEKFQSLDWNANETNTIINRYLNK
ncbi:MAG: TlpA family protein disulfide reductase [Ignavibacteriae bacterium]|nr:TlpA family protein disulfide reductase [Ignavibacteriota bacterium]